MVQRAFKFRIYPDSGQQALLRQMFGASRWVWNKALAWRSDAWQSLGERVTAVDFSRELTFLKTLEPYAWLRDVPATVFGQTLRDQDKAFSNFFAKRARYPRFKRRHGGQSIRFQLDQRVVMNNYRDGELLKLPGLGEIDVRWSRAVSGTPKMATVKRDAAGRFFVSFMAESAVQALPPTTKAVGLDFGLKDLVVTSEGWKSGNPRHLRHAERRLKRAQRALSHTRKGSHRRAIQRSRVARLHARVADTRADTLHKLSTQLVRDHGVLAIEDLAIKGMARTRLAKSIGDAGLAELRRQLTYKADWYGRKLMVIDRWEPTTKVCSECSHVMESIALSVRAWDCPICHATHDRDVNAARNILMVAMGGRPKGSTESANARGGRTIPSADRTTADGMLAPEESRTARKRAGGCHG